MSTFELFLMLLFLILLIFLLAWLVILGLDYFLPRMRGRLGPVGRLLRYLKEQRDMISETGENRRKGRSRANSSRMSERMSLNGQMSRRGSATRDGMGLGPKDDPEKGAVGDHWNESFGLKEARRRSGIV
jgi:hypothetical protein